MLILNRKPGESIIIEGDNVIKITVTSISVNANGDNVAHIGIDAPKHISVNREEIHKKKVERLDRIFKTNG